MKTVSIVKIPFDTDVELYIKREDQIDAEISGNKYWKLLYNVEEYLKKNINQPLIISFGGAFSNHISALSALGRNLGIPTLGIIRGEELEQKWQENPTLDFAKKNGMEFKFITREDYRNKENFTQVIQNQFPDALIIPEGGSNELAVKGIKNMLTPDTQIFDYLCTAVGTGGTIAGISKFAEPHQEVIGFCVVKDVSLQNRIFELSGKDNFQLIEASFGGYGKISPEIISFINEFYKKYAIPLDPIYTGKMMYALMKKIKNKKFKKGTKILAFHTGGLQGIQGANLFLAKKNQKLISFI